MKTVSVGQVIDFPEPDGIHGKTVKAILWSEKGKGETYCPKDTVSISALEWCIVLFDDGTWYTGADIPVNSNPYF
jgi:hypothetical protein